MAAVYHAIAKEIHSGYVLRYTTHNPAYDGTLRTVTVTAAGQHGTGTYRVDYPPEARLDAATTALSDSSQTPGVALTINGLVVDLDAASQSQNLQAGLFYRTSGGSNYVEMALPLNLLSS